MLCTSLLLTGCGSTGGQAAAEGVNTSVKARVVPAGLFAQRAQEEVKLATPRPDANKRSTADKPAGPLVWLYVSPASQAELVKTGWTANANTRPWEVFLRKYKIPSTRISTAEEINKMPATGVLLLPSTVALSDQERQAIQQLRQRGGAVLSTWLSGVRKETGELTGFDFMEQVLDVRVAGNTEETEEDNFIVVHGDNPVFHLLPAGTRVWMDRIPNALPLRLTAKHDAAQIMDWSRTFAPTRKTGLVSFDEKTVGPGLTSRTVTLGYAEPAWAAADPKQIELLAYSALTWAWPDCTPKKARRVASATLRRAKSRSLRAFSSSTSVSLMRF